MLFVLVGRRRELLQRADLEQVHYRDQPDSLCEICQGSRVLI